MAKKRRDSTEEAERKTRKDILIARKEAQQTRRIRLAMGGVALLLGLILVIAIVNELFVAPNRPVAVVSGEEIGLREWQNRVRYERAQRILLLENQLEAFGGDVGIIQQFAGQMILDLQNAETIGQDVLDQMVNELAVRQMARVRGLSVTEAEAEEELGASFNYFGGDSPTPFPTPTNTVVPTPSLTPVPTSVITELLPTATVFPTFTPGPTSAPPATATPVSRESFEEQFDELLSQFNDYGVDEETYRSVVRQQLLQEKLLEQVATENELPDEAPHASIYDMSFADEETAAEAAALIEAEDFLTVWNTLRTAPSELDIQGTASELLWRTQEQLAASLGEEVAQAAFTIDLNEPSDVLVQTIDDENSRFHLIQVSGREVRKLSTSALAQDKAELLSTLIDQYLTGNLETTNFWRGRVPTQPVLDPKFLAAPTATPLAIPSPAPTVAGGS